MGIKYSLRKNHLRDKKGFTIFVEHGQTLHIDEIVREAIYGSTLTEADALAFMASFKLQCEKHLRDGSRINWDGFFSISLTVKGLVEQPDQPLSPENNPTQVNMRISKKYERKVTAGLEYSKVIKGTKLPKIMTVYDYGEDSQNEKLTMGDMIHIKGENLKFDPAKPDEGIFILLSDKTEIKVKYRGKPGNTKLEFIMPVIKSEADICFLEIRSRMGTQTMRMGRSNNEFNLLKVPAA